MVPRKETVLIPMEKRTSLVLRRPSFKELCRAHGKSLDLCSYRACPPLSFSRLFGISRVYAEGPPKETQNSENGTSASSGSVSRDADSKNAISEADSKNAISDADSKNAKALESLARLYIAKESGWERVKDIFRKDHRGKTSQELDLISVTLVQAFVLTFFCKYIPAAKFARNEFIREHQGTVFRTRLEAIRRLKDHIFLRGAAEGGLLAGRVTLFSASFLFLSQTISSYRNKTSVTEYGVAAAITGGLARLSSGVKAIFAGSVVGGAIGSAVGLIAFAFLSAYGLTQQERHLANVISKLEVQRYIVGETVFHQTLAEALKEQNENQMEKLPTS